MFDASLVQVTPVYLADAIFEHFERHWITFGVCLVDSTFNDIAFILVKMRNTLDNEFEGLQLRRRVDLAYSRAAHCIKTEGI